MSNLRALLVFVGITLATLVWYVFTACHAYPAIHLNHYTIPLLAVAAGLVAHGAYMHFGWRVGIAFGVFFTFMPTVWRLATQGRPMAFWLAGAVVFVYVLNLILIRIIRKAGFIKLSKLADKWGHYAAWGTMVLAFFFFCFSITYHQYRRGYVTAVYAQGLIESAGDRFVVYAGIVDDELDYYGAHKPNVDAFPDDADIAAAAMISQSSLAEVIARKYPSRILVVDTLERWNARWKAIERFLDVRGEAMGKLLRRRMAFEANAIGNKLQDEGNAKDAWHLYKRIYEDVDRGNVSALLNMSEMLRLGYQTEQRERDLVIGDVERLLKSPIMQQHGPLLVRISGPVRTPIDLLEKVKTAREARIAELKARGEELHLSAEVIEMLENNTRMVEAMQQGDEMEEATPTKSEAPKEEAPKAEAHPTPTEPPVTKLTLDDITRVIVTKIKQNRAVNDKIAELLKAYGYKQIRELPPEKYEAFLNDLAQL